MDQDGTWAAFYFHRINLVTEQSPVCGSLKCFSWDSVQEPHFHWQQCESLFHASPNISTFKEPYTILPHIHLVQAGISYHNGRHSETLNAKQLSMPNIVI